MENEKPIPKHIAIAGNIGAGKTSLSALLGKHFDWEVHYEDTEDNPYLSDFYDDMTRWSFNLQIYFLNNRYRQILDIQNGDHTVIQDRTIFEDAHIFAPNLHEMGLMSKRDFDNYFDLFSTMSSQVKAPDLLIYLRASVPTLVDHIQTRGRDYEGNMSLDYLKKLNQRYEEWIETYNHGPLLIVNTDRLNFIQNKEDLGTIIEMIDGELNGLFS
ncbi:MAG: deoxynucleoside kinase [Saprospiraceae bacterium]|jgi:deoxyadenosine/deoxycytidine kinase|nr:MAG: deoxyadenosine kinase [Candidatus Parvibacillus calidus]MBX2936509.1 deoxynucleoside kinase [Saprospiraceae bacterium]MBK7739321.1 deoxynucleoside kinase [Candidatus Parvibacillus calidus]MBX7178659.1 deoxynucleoside kinase [Saprospiraceae bacterium]MCB0590368.1 deoxynucleoside kinase [Saprospiraceae bacterium]